MKADFHMNMVVLDALADQWLVVAHHTVGGSARTARRLVGDIHGCVGYERMAVAWACGQPAHRRVGSGSVSADWADCYEHMTVGRTALDEVDWAAWPDGTSV